MFSYRFNIRAIQNIVDIYLSQTVTNKASSFEFIKSESCDISICNLWEDFENLAV